jgi:hypothetical protein
LQERQCGIAHLRQIDLVDAMVVSAGRSVTAVNGIVTP